MFLILWKAVALTYAAFYSLTMTVAQVSTAICEPSFQWMFNSLGQSPCLVAAYVQGACEPNGQWTMSSLPGPTYGYLGPTLFQANPCTCSSVAYSLSSACGDCQGADWPLFSEWTSNCSSADISYSVFPHAIPLGTAIPAWAYGQITTVFDPNQAQLIMESGAPESTASGAPPATTGISQPPDTITGGNTFFSD
ncbi:hypothetical protein A0H81_04290 [Grifola frondosa]|uniref:Uncharacterized protein n=1 Tax=Grifola frondosa TaxID=5627 RepID=A0A1C7MF14_GRIFR|nr:hypothetical protein A0H81_04290 [Grifola frondosa]